MGTRSQQYAKSTYDVVVAIKDTGIAKKYGALCYRFPLIVKDCGLAAAFGFLAAKGKGDEAKPETRLLGHYAQLLGFQNGDTLRTEVVNADLTQYRQLTYKTLALAEWFKRYAEGVLKVDSTDQADNGGDDA